MTELNLEYERYDATTILFHWATALLVLALFGTAMAWNYLPRGWGLRWLTNIHVSLGIGLTAVLIGRTVWRMTAGRRLAGEGNRALNLAAHFVHFALYVLLFVQVMLGLGIEWFGGQSLSMFGFFEIPSPFIENRDVGDQLEQIHNLVAWSLIVLAGGHALAAIGHRFLLKDRVLHRMLPPLASGSEATSDR